jgi:uncharacterized RDD family membrane protein YckC
MASDTFADPPHSAAQHSRTGSDATDALSERVLAALLDLGALAILFVIVGLLSGGYHSQTETSASNPSIHESYHGIYLTGSKFVLFLVLCLLYYFVLEALWSQTLGKRAMRLRVVSLDGGTPSTKAIAVRTLGRVIDVLPFLYLIGMIALLVGKPRRRIGDRLARTTVALSGSRH